MRRVDTGQHFDASELLPLWRRLDELERQMGDANRQFQRNNVLSRRRLDCSNAAGVNAYIVASSLIATARENQFLLEATMTTPGMGVGPQSTPNLIRPAFEAAAWALWILDGQHAQERRLRGLQRAWEDQRQSDAWLNELRPMVPPEDQQKATERQGAIAHSFRKKADEAGIPWAQVTQKRNLTAELTKLRVLRDDEVLRRTMVAFWRKLSGIQHGFVYAALLGSSRADRHAVKIEGGWEVTLVTDDASLFADCQASAALQLWAMSTYIRSTQFA